MTLANNNKSNKKRGLIQVRVTEEEKKTFEENAKAAAMNLSDFIKWRGIDKQPRTKMATRERDVLIRLLGQLGKIGSNINQIDKAVQEKSLYYQNVGQTVFITALDSLKGVSDLVLEKLKGAKIAEPELETLNLLLGELDKIGSDINQIAKAMNDKSLHNVNVKPAVILASVNKLVAISDQILKTLQSGHTGKNSGGGKTTSELPSDKSGQ